MARALVNPEDPGVISVIVADVGLQGPASNSNATLFIQETQPTTPGAYFWIQTDSDGNILDMLVGTN